MTRIVILGSGRGSNFLAIYRSILEGKLDVEIVGVISDRPDALILKRAEEAGLNAIAVPYPPVAPGLSAPERRDHHAQLLLAELNRLKPRFLVLAGYMRILSPRLIRAFADERGFSRIVNIHPSLLPAFPGVEGYAQAFHYGVQTTGVTVHFVNDGLDEGPICFQESFSIEDCGSVAEVEARGLVVEHRIYPASLSWILTEKFRVEKRPDGRLCVRKS